VNSINLIESYLNHRTQRVKIDEILSVTLGVPQGSILGPLLFEIYINDLAHYVPQVNSVLFADDTTLCKSDASLQRLRLGPHYRLFVGRQFSWLLNKYEDLCECAH
jgi:hypothetical protein